MDGKKWDSLLKLMESRVESVEDVKRGVYNYFKYHFRAKFWNMTSSLEEGSEIWDCDSPWCVGLDRVLWRFIMQFREQMMGNFLKYIEEFQKNKCIIGGGNNQFIVLISKNDNPQRLEEYMSIW